MRIIGSIDHPIYKITIFKTDTRFAIKFENRDLEQTYKVRISESIRSVADLKKLVDKTFLTKVGTGFAEMERSLYSSLNEHFPKNDFDEFDVII